jgi:hypothetical protein
MKKFILATILFLSVLMIFESCAKKAACGNTKKVVKKKTKSLKKNSHFNMM